MSEESSIPSRLPEELLVKCIEYLHTEHWALLNLCKTSKQFRRLTIPFLYNNVELNEYQSIRKFLLRIIRNQSLAPLVKALTLDWNRLEYSSSRPTEHLKSRAELEEIRLTTLKLNIDVIDGLKVDSSSMIAIILLCSVPNLVKLHIKSQFHRESGHFFESETLFGTRFLRKLEHYIDQGEINLPAVFFRFFQLPSIHSMELRDWSSLPLDLGRYRGTSPVESICLEHCFIGRDSITDVLRIPRNLKHLDVKRGRFEPDFTLFGEGPDHVWNSLETLSLVHLNPERLTIRSFENFKALTRLRISFQLLLGLMSASTFQLVDILPPNLKQLELLYERRRGGQSVHWTFDNCIESVREFLEARENKNSPGKLTRIHFPKEDMQYEPLKSLVELGARVGVVISN